MAKRNRRVCSEDVGPVELDRVIFINNVQNYMSQQSIATIDEMTERIGSIIEQCHVSNCIAGLEHRERFNSSEGPAFNSRVDYRVFGKPDVSTEKLKEIAASLRPLMGGCNVFYTDGGSITTAVLTNVRHSIESNLRSIHNKPHPGQCCSVSILFWLDNKGRKSRLAYRLIESGKPSLWTSGMSRPESLAVYIGVEKDFMGFRAEFVSMLNELYLNPDFKVPSDQDDQYACVHVHLGLFVGDHKALWAVFKTQQKLSRHSDTFSNADLSLPFVLHQGCIKFSMAAINAARSDSIVEAPSNDDEPPLHLLAQPHTAVNDIPVAASAAPPTIPLAAEDEDLSDDDRIWKPAERTTEYQPARGDNIKYIKQDPLLFDKHCVFDLDYFLMVPPVLHNMVHGICSSAVSSLISLLPYDNEARKELGAGYGWIVGVERDCSIVANGRFYRQLLSKALDILMPALSISKVGHVMIIADGCCVDGFWRVDRLEMVAALMVFHMYMCDVFVSCRTTFCNYFGNSYR